MEKKNLLLILCLAVFIISTAAVLNSNGKAGRTGSPNETTCVSCHSDFPLNSGGGSVTITSPNMTGWVYTLGQTYTINVTVAKTGAVLFGLGVEALSGTVTYANAGTFICTNPAETHLLTYATNGRISVTQMANGGLTNNTKTFSFNWTAPTTNVGNVTFYVAGNAANNSGDESGDYIYTTTQVATKSAVGISSLSNSTDGLIVANYPNPFTNSTKIEFELIKSGHISIDVFNILGVNVSSLTKDKYYSEGKHEILFDSSTLPSGVYMYKVKVSSDDKSFTQTKLMNIIR